MFRYSPNEILAVRAERGLLEEARDEAMILDIIDVLLLQRSLAAAVPHRELVLVLGHLVQGVLLLGHDDDGFFFFSSPPTLQNITLTTNSQWNLLGTHSDHDWWLVYYTALGEYSNRIFTAFSSLLFELFQIN